MWELFPRRDSAWGKCLGLAQGQESVWGRRRFLETRKVGSSEWEREERDGTSLICGEFSENSDCAALVCYVGQLRDTDDDLLSLEGGPEFAWVGTFRIWKCTRSFLNCWQDSRYVILSVLIVCLQHGCLLLGHSVRTKRPLKRVGIEERLFCLHERCWSHDTKEGEVRITLKSLSIESMTYYDGWLITM